MLGDEGLIQRRNHVGHAPACVLARDSPAEQPPRESRERANQQRLPSFRGPISPSPRHLPTPNPELARKPPAMAAPSPFYCCIVEPRCRLCQFHLEDGDPVLVGTCPAAAPSLGVLVA